MKIRTHQELEVYREAFGIAMEIFEVSKSFPKEEKYSLTDQIRRSSRSVCANVAEAFRRRRYPNSFVSKLNDAKAEAAETQTWLEFAGNCKYVEPEYAARATGRYDAIIGRLVVMSNQPESWTL
jgi:four helix bundle protein